MVRLLGHPAFPVVPAEGFSVPVATRSAPLRRATVPYGEDLQHAKEANVRRAAGLLDGRLFLRGELFSWHRHLGPPVAARGFHRGPELHDDRLTSGEGGGLCQVANLLFHLAMSAGWTLVERHRHALDLFPDSGRDVPFGAGATVFFPAKDLKLVNPFAVPMRLTVQVDGTHVHGAVTAPVDPGFRCTLEEREHRLEHTAQGVFRHNVLVRRWWMPGWELDEPIAEHHARVLYPVAVAGLTGLTGERRATATAGAGCPASPAPGCGTAVARR